MKLARTMLAAVLTLAPVAVQADTLYQAAPPPAGPGHPLRLGPDHRAQQVGDLVYVVFDFASSNSNNNSYAGSNQFNAQMSQGTGNLAIWFLKNGAALAGQSSSAASKAASGSTSFISTMMATVTDVLPSGAMQITGTQEMTVNGQHETLRITGYIRPEDLDSTDAILSTRVADVQATFNGNDQKNKNLLQRIINFLF